MAAEIREGVIDAASQLEFVRQWWPDIRKKFPIGSSERAKVETGLQ